MAQMTDRLEVHLGHLSPDRWDALETRPAEFRKYEASRQDRPALATHDLDWTAKNLQPRWVGDDSSRCVAALEPNQFTSHGAEDWHRVVEGCNQRGETTLVVTSVGDPADDDPVRSLFGFAANTWLPGSDHSTVGGARLKLAARPQVAPGLGRADRDLAIRLLNRQEDLPWWTLELAGYLVSDGSGTQPRAMQPEGSLMPLLLTDAGETVAAVWTTPRLNQRVWVLPWLPDWTFVLDWLTSQAVPEFVPTAARRVRSAIADSPELLTSNEADLVNQLDALDAHYTSRRQTIVDQLQAAQATVAPVRDGLLFGTGQTLVDAVAAVARDAGLQVTDLDSALGDTQSADLLLAHQGGQVLIEVKSASGNASERLVDSARRHLRTWPSLQPGTRVDGVTLVVNHRHQEHPSDRGPVYTRDAFIEDLDVPVVSAADLFTMWRTKDFGSVRDALLGRSTDQDSGDLSHSPDLTENNPDLNSPPPAARRRMWRRRES